jgi:dynein intermediate chain 1
MVGTEEGMIYKCNTAYSSVYMQTYAEAHNMPVHRIVFNKFNSSIFASCSGDWRIKIWEDERPLSIRALLRLRLFFPFFFYTS